MKYMLLALAAIVTIPAIAHAQETAPEEECCCEKHEQEGDGCCPEDMAGEDMSGEGMSGDAHAGPSHIPAHGPRINS